MKRFAIISVILTLLVSCSGMDATYQEFIKDGTALYVAKAENVVAQPGVNRIKLTVDRFTDARVETMTVYWDNRTYEQTFDVNLGGATEIYVENVSEGSHIFEIVTHDSAGNNSIPVTVTVMVYGDSFLSFNSESSISASATAAKTSIDIVHSSSYYYKYLNLLYTTKAGQEKSLDITSDTEKLELTDCDHTAGLRYRTVFSPDEACIDEITTEYRQLAPDYIAIEVYVDKEEVGLQFHKGDVAQVAVSTNSPNFKCTAVADDEASQWLVLSLEDNVLSVKTSEVNLGTSERIGYITVTSEGVSRQIRVVQSPINPKYGTAYGSEGIIFWQNPENKSEYKIISAEWKNSVVWSSNSNATGATSFEDGESNSRTIRAMADYGSTTYPAEYFCESLGEGWRLPSMNELQNEFFTSFNGVVYEESTVGLPGAITDAEKACRDRYNTNMKAISRNGVPFSTTDAGQIYLSNTETGADNVYAFRMGNRLAASASKKNRNFVRCVKVVTINE